MCSELERNNKTIQSCFAVDEVDALGGNANGTFLKDKVMKVSAGEQPLLLSSIFDNHEFGPDQRTEGGRRCILDRNIRNNAACPGARLLGVDTGTGQSPYARL